jgi:hypothetical protein
VFNNSSEKDNASWFLVRVVLAPNKQKKDPIGHRNAEAQSTTKYTQRPLAEARRFAVWACKATKSLHLAILSHYNLKLQQSSLLW